MKQELFVILVAISFVFNAFAFEGATLPGHQGIPLKISSQKYKFLLAMARCQGIQNLQTNRKVIALTFDDGPHRKYTKAVLEVLKRYQIHATFFVVGEDVRRYPGLIRAEFEDGHVVGNHTFTHPRLTAIDEDAIRSELTQTNEAIGKILHLYPILFRPPYGLCDERLPGLVKDLGYRTILWDDMTDDYHVENNSGKIIALNILKAARPGSIIDLHDGGGPRKNTVEALPIIIEGLKQEGYEFLTIPELLNVKPYRAVEPS